MARAVLLGPALQLLKAIAPVASAAQQTHHHQPSLRDRGGDVVIDNSGLSQSGQVERPQRAAEQVTIGCGLSEQL